MRHSHQFVLLSYSLWWQGWNQTELSSRAYMSQVKVKFELNYKKTYLASLRTYAIYVYEFNEVELILFELNSFNRWGDEPSYMYISSYDGSHLIFCCNSCYEDLPIDKCYYYLVLGYSRKLDFFFEKTKRKGKRN